MHALAMLSVAGGRLWVVVAINSMAVHGRVFSSTPVKLSRSPKFVKFPPPFPKLTVHGDATLLYGRVALILPPNSNRDRCGFDFPFSVTREPGSSAPRGQLVPGLLLLV